ncbi:uncharacterized protein M421DRAFT_246842 [Didymella exigua CBS 183.55]|uniref:Uncharacterized protein n=1 Tax=Didymella exigua CBS 183.55 TaxID=1150837 RepID=A0A6A5RYU6_9PLEO|nr:uncharacterized protein M421DRAFT_246842 [Didymella exigua CBS 183.55]KAF1932689.1 hypothetical protein M421DRAFT_246842 [Didymella exigua CBS 183.55]
MKREALRSMTSSPLPNAVYWAGSATQDIQVYAKSAEMITQRSKPHLCTLSARPTMSMSNSVGCTMTLGTAVEYHRTSTSPDQAFSPHQGPAGISYPPTPSYKKTSESQKRLSPSPSKHTAQAIPHTSLTDCGRSWLIACPCLSPGVGYGFVFASCSTVLLARLWGCVSGGMV